MKIWSDHLVLYILLYRLLTTLYHLLKKHLHLQFYANEIKQSIDDVVSHLNHAEIDRLLQNIHEAQEVILIGYSSTLDLAKSMQTSLMMSNKITVVPEEEALLNTMIQQANEQTMIIVFSSFGTIFNKNADSVNKITNSAAYSVLITQHTKNVFTNFFDQTIHATSNNYLQIGTYPLTFFIDFIIQLFLVFPLLHLLLDQQMPLSLPWHLLPFSSTEPLM